MLLIYGNRGLCGAYNTYISRLTKQRVEDLNAQGISPKLIIVGKKGRAALKGRLAGLDLNYTEQFFPMEDQITASMSNEIAQAVSNLFLSGEVDKVEVVYTKFKNLLTSDAKIRTILPLSPTGIEDPEDETFKLTSEDGKLTAVKEEVKKVKAKEIEPDVIFDQSPDVILNSMLPLYLNSLLLSMLFDSLASELSSRMVAMKAATDNAKTLSEDLQIQYNKKRQAAITAEICEISAGASASEITESVYGGELNEVDSEDSILPSLMQEIMDGSLPDWSD